MKIWNNDIVEDVENQPNDEQFIHVFGPNTIVITTVLILLRFIFTTLPIQMLTVRIGLLFHDSFYILAAVSLLTNFYYKNPHLRKYVWRKLFSSSSIQPQNYPTEIELYPI